MSLSSNPFRYCILLCSAALLAACCGSGGNAGSNNDVLTKWLSGCNSGGVGGSSSGQGWQTPQLIDPNNAQDATSPHIAVDVAGNALAVWQQTDGGRNNIWANRYTAGSGWGTARLIQTDNVGDATNPQIAVDPVGDALAVWQQSDGTRNNIWANRYTTSGGWSNAELVETNNVGDALMPQVVVDTAGNGIAVWYQRNGAHYNIEANLFK